MTKAMREFLARPDAAPEAHEIRGAIRQFLSEPQETGGARLEILGGEAQIPFLHLHGTPDERARFFGAFQQRILRDVLAYLGTLAHDYYPLLGFGFARAMLPVVPVLLRMVPAEMRREIRVFAEAGGINPYEALFVNLLGDLDQFGCTIMACQPAVTANSSLLVGRNLDFDSFGILDCARLVTVHHPDPRSAEIPSASLGFLGMWGIHTGWNREGLFLGNTLVRNTVGYFKSALDNPVNLLSGFRDFAADVKRLCSHRLPTSWAYTQILRRCASTREALALLGRFGRPLSDTTVMLADTGGDAVVVEWGRDRTVIREPENGFVFTTNDFRAPGMAEEPAECRRYDDMSGISANQAGQHLDAAAMKRILHKTNQGEETLHSAVFELGNRTNLVHIAAGNLPSSAGPWSDGMALDVWG